MPPKKKVKKAGPPRKPPAPLALKKPQEPPCTTCVNRIEFTVTFKPGTYGNSVEKVNRCWLTDIDVDAIESIECNQWRGK